MGTIGDGYVATIQATFEPDHTQSRRAARISEGLPCPATLPMGAPQCILMTAASSQARPPLLARIVRYPSHTFSDVLD